MRYKDISDHKVANFICVGSHCNEPCCMYQVLGRCFDIAKAWESGKHDDLIRVMLWRVQHGERTMEELRKLGIELKAEVI